MQQPGRNSTGNKAGSAARKDKRIQRAILLSAAVIAALVLGFFILLYFTLETHQEVNRAVSDAINEPGGGDYARAVAITRAASDRSQSAKDFEVGELIVGSFDRRGARRPAESLQQGLAMIEKVAVQSSEVQRYAPQTLRNIFQKGVGAPPNNIPIDNPVADCWHRLENGGAGDPARCVALRRQRLPQLSG